MEVWHPGKRGEPAKGGWEAGEVMLSCSVMQALSLPPPPPLPPNVYATDHMSPRCAAGDQMPGGGVGRATRAWLGLMVDG